jgi:hypothetical protein
MNILQPYYIYQSRRLTALLSAKFGKVTVERGPNSTTYTREAPADETHEVGLAISEQMEDEVWRIERRDRIVWNVAGIIASVVIAVALGALLH